uniref:Glutaryl 7-ACA acylase - Bacillus laterosporus n=1 Tax=Rheinheimera sp. BAL341 TaxID=1708203 RepID=A0A486XUT5_9GAMM
MLKFTAFCVACFVFLLGHPSMSVAASDASAREQKVDFSGPHLIPVTLDISLSGWRFATDDKPKAVILAFTPYSPQGLIDRAVFFASHDYVFLVVSSRGRGDSEGTFQPFSAADVADTAKVIQWAAAQPWSDGQVAMWGGSYVGYSQWAALAQLLAPLKTIAPAAAVYPGVDFPAYNNIRFNYSFQWLQALQGRGDWFSLAFRDAIWTERVVQLRRQGLPTTSLTKYTGSNNVIARQWLNHPTLDSYWQQAVPTDTALQQTRLPVLTITGYFDADQRGALAHHQRYISAGNEQRQNATLLLGPWDHAGTRTPTLQQAGIMVEPNSVLDLNALHLSWYDWVLKQKIQPPSLRSGIHYFLMGTNEWRYLSQMPEADVAWHLHPRSDNSFSAISPGLLSTADGPAAEFSYTYQPQQAALTNPVALTQQANEQRDVKAINGDGLVFVSELFTESMDLVGAPKLQLNISVNAVDTDIHVLLEEIMADGETLRLSFDMQRLRHRDGLNKSALLQPGRLYPVSFDSFTFIGKRIARGSRLRLSLHSNPPLYLEHNFTGPEDVSLQTAQNTNTIDVTIIQTEQQPNILWLPIK